MADTEIVMRACHVALFAVLLISGCGGGGSELPPAGGSTVTAGNLQLTGSLNPVSFTSGIGANVYALTGSITKATMTDPNPTLDETEIFVSRTSNLGFELVAMSPNGSNVRVLAQGPYSYSMAVSTTHLYFLDRSDSKLKRIPYGGGSITALKSLVTSFALSPNGAKLVYFTSSNELRYCNADGSADNLIGSIGASRTVLGFISASTALLYDSGQTYSAEVSPGGGISSVQSIAGMVTASMQSSARRVYWAAGSTLSFGTLAVSGYLYETANAPGILLNSIGCAPDSSAVAVARIDNPDALEVWPDNLGSGTTIDRSAAIFGVAWGPFVSSRQFLPSGVFATAGAAILFSETSSRVPSVVIADATTRTTMAATRVSVDGAVNITYRLDCDELTKLFYSKGANYALTQVVNSISGLKGAFVSFDATTGLLSSVVTFAKRPTVSHRAGSLVIEGDGLTLHDLKGSKRVVQPSGRIVIAE